MCVLGAQQLALAPFSLHKRKERIIIAYYLLPLYNCLYVHERQVSDYLMGN